MKDDLEPVITRMVVAGNNSEGEPDFYFVKVRCTRNMLSQDKHKEAAEADAKENGYEPKLVYDEYDMGGGRLLDLFVWESASTITIGDYYCSACHSTGWLLGHPIRRNDIRVTCIERCDACDMFESDLDAAQAFFKASAPDQNEWCLESIWLKERK